jgi:hypothetical protein
VTSGEVKKESSRPSWDRSIGFAPFAKALGKQGEVRGDVGGIGVSLLIHFELSGKTRRYPSVASERVGNELIPKELEQPGGEEGSSRVPAGRQAVRCRTYGARGFPS